MSEKVPPYSLDAEKSTLGSMMLSRDAIATAIEILNAEDFYWQSHSIIFEAVTNLFNQGKPVDLVTVNELLREREELEDVRGASYVTSLANAVPTAVNIEHYAQIVEEKSLLRRLIKVSRKINKLGYNEVEEADKLLEEAEQMIFEISQKRDKQGYSKISKIALETVDDLERVQQTEGEITGVPTGFADLDRMTSGFQDSDLIIIAARPSMGKTALALNIAQYVALEEDITTAIFSLEMAKKQLVKRMFSSEGQVDSHRMRTGKLSSKDWRRVTNVAGRLGKKDNILIDDTPQLTPAEIRAKARRMKAEHGLDLILIDYLQLMETRGKRENKQVEVSDISRSLKGLAKELEVPVVSLSQLSRAVEQRQDKRPRLSDLRSSGSIEQDADVVAFLYRDEYYSPDTEKPGITEIIIGKQRNGPVGTIELAFQKEYTKFVDLSKRTGFKDSFG